MLLAPFRTSRALSVALLTLALLPGCGPATRPLRGALPGAEQATATPAVPPTLSASDPRLRPRPSPSPGLAAGPSPAAVASASPAPSPPIVRTIQPSANTSVPLGAPVTVSAVLVGRGADLAAATLAVDGAEVAPEIDKSNPRQWAIHATQPLPPGIHTVRVFVRDTAGAPGGFTWQFTVGEPTPTPAAEGPAEPPRPEPAGTPAPAEAPTPQP